MSYPDQFSRSMYASLEDLLTAKAKYYQEQNAKLVGALNKMHDRANTYQECLDIAEAALKELDQ